MFSGHIDQNHGLRANHTDFDMPTRDYPSVKVAPPALQWGRVWFWRAACIEWVHGCLPNYIYVMFLQLVCVPAMLLAYHNS